MELFAGRVSEIMRDDFTAVNPGCPLGKASSIMVGGEREMIIVSENERFRGVLYRRDLLKLCAHKLQEKPVNNYLSVCPVILAPGDDVETAREEMIASGLNVLPVVDDGVPSGVIGSLDLLSAGRRKEYDNHIAGSNNSLVEIRAETADISTRLNDFLDAEILKILDYIGQIAAEKNEKAYLVGGLVRDLLLGRSNFDLDFVITGSLNRILKAAADKLDGDWKFNKQFKTGHINLGEYNLDFATARREIYPTPGSLPEIEEADIGNDLFRRDFTVNSLAVMLNPGKQGLLFDYFGGRKDLKNGLLRVLHCMSFLDDPTRIIRGLRMAARNGFILEEKTEQLIDDALTGGVFPGLTPERVLREMKLLFADRITEKLINLLQKIPVLNLLDPGIKIDQRMMLTLQKLEEILAYYREKNYNIREWLPRMSVILRDVDTETIAGWNIRKRDEEILTFSADRKLITEIDSCKDPLKLKKLLDGLYPGQLVILSVKGNRKTQRKIDRYIDKLSAVALTIDGNDLLQMGLDPGPEIKEILDEVWRARVRDDINSYGEELEYAGELIERRHQ